MAHDAIAFARVRNAYVARGLALAEAATEAGVSARTARRWRRLAEERGDAWDTARLAGAPTAGPASAADMLEPTAAPVLAALGRIERALERDPGDAYLPATIVATAGDLLRLRRTLLVVGAGLAFSTWAALAVALAL
jgi:transposase-like protein